MFADIIALILAVVVILLCAELFTNGIEWFGHILKLSERTVGSILAALGTSLPETIVPLVAIIGFSKSHGTEVSIGAIAGAPFMLVTLAFAVCGTAIWISSLNKQRSYSLNMDSSIVVRNLKFFLVAYSIGVFATFLPASWHWLVAICLILIYPIYVVRTIAHPADDPSGSPERLHISKLLLRESNHAMLIVLQILAGVAGIIYGAYLFVDHLQTIATCFHVSPLLISLVITPIATELPEQATSITWARRGKDSLALGNISGSMVFQSCFAVALGVAFTPWILNVQILATALITFCLAATYMILAKKEILTPAHMMCGTLIYIATISGVVYSGMLNH